MPTYRNSRPRFSGPKDLSRASAKIRDNVDGLLLERMLNPKYFTYFERFTQAPTPYSVTYGWPAEDAGTGDIAVDDIVYTVTEDSRLVGISYTTMVAGTDGSAVTAQLKHGLSTDDPTAGELLHTGTLNLKTTAATVVNMTLSTTLADLVFRTGERVTFDVTGTTTAARGNVTLTFVPHAFVPGLVIEGTNPTASGLVDLPGGGLRLETAGADGDGQFLEGLAFPRGKIGGTIFNTDLEPVFMCNILTGPDAADVTSCIIHAGLKLTDTPTTATDADQVFFRFEDDIISGDWQAINSIGGTDVTTDTNITVAAANLYRLVIHVGSDRVARFYINDLLVDTSLALTASTDLLWVIGVEADGAAEAKELDIRNFMVSQLYPSQLA